MPISAPCTKKPVINTILEKIRSDDLKNIEILDLGIGYGDFGRLVKRKIDIKTKITGVEIWENYKNRKWDYYDDVIIDDIRRYLKRTKKKYDIILLIEVLEHFNQEDGVEVINRLMKMTKRLLIVSTPVTNSPQGAWRGNLYEEHKYFWKEEEFLKLGFKKIFSRWIPIFPANIITGAGFWPLFAKSEIYVFEKK